MENFKALFFIAVTCIGLTQAKVSHKVHCTDDIMHVEIGIPDGGIEDKEIYLNNLKTYPSIKCKPLIKGSLIEFKLSLKNFHECSVTRMVNKITEVETYYHKIIIKNSDSMETIEVKCIKTRPNYKQTNSTHKITRRDLLPVGFQEQEDLEITSLTERAPEPMLGVGVRQGGQLVTGELNVSPGTPLTMEIYLDENSSPIYGLSVPYMQVTDTKSQEETIIFNGCSVDPYLFDNFNTIDGDFLSAKFRAFKFPDSTYVQFRATVNVCLDKCQGTQCSNGKIGYGRRKREILQITDPNKIYEVSMATFIKIGGNESVSTNEISEIKEKLLQLQQRLARNSRGSSIESDYRVNQLQNVSAASVEESVTLKTTQSRGQTYSIALTLMIITLTLNLVGCFL